MIEGKASDPDQNIDFDSDQLFSKLQSYTDNDKLPKLLNQIEISSTHSLLP